MGVSCVGGHLYSFGKILPHAVSLARFVIPCERPQLGNAGNIHSQCPDTPRSLWVLVVPKQKGPLAQVVTLVVQLRSVCCTQKERVIGTDDNITQLFVLPGQLIDEEIAAMEKAMREGGASPSRLSGITASNQELRERLQINIVESLLGFIHSVGKAFFTLEEKRGNALPGVCYTLTARKVFFPDVANALIDPSRIKPLCPLSHPDVFFAHAYEWYVRGVKTAPHYFCRREWELVVNESGELVVQLTGEREEIRPHSREKAKVVRLKMGFREKIQNESSPKK